MSYVDITVIYNHLEMSSLRENTFFYFLFFARIFS